MPLSDSISAAPHAHPARTPHLWLDPQLPYPLEYVSWARPTLSVSIVDSIAADTVTPHILTEAQTARMAAERRADSIAAARAYAEAHTGHAEGLAPRPMTPSFGHIDAVGLALAALLALAGVCAGGIRRALRSYLTALWSVRRRQNAFDDTHTAPLRASLLLALIAVVFGGLALYCATPWGAAPTLVGAAAAVAAAGCYYVFLYVAYRTVGYAFATPSGRSMWLAGYVASQACTGLALIVPVLLLLYVPEWRTPLLWVCGCLFLAGKTIFIIKGFRIFYHKIRSLLYFILYLCALEIIPVLALYAALNSIEALLAA